MFEIWRNISVFIGNFYHIFEKFSRYFRPAQPTQDAKSVQIFIFFKKKPKMLFGNLITICWQRLYFSAWLKNRGFRVCEIEIQWHKSKETPRTNPENIERKKKQMLLFSLGVLHGFCRKSNEDEF